MIEPERYELTEPPRYRFDVDRRDFLKLLTALGGGLLVVSSWPASAEQETGRASQGAAAPNDVASWIHIGPDGRVTAYTGKVEIGQNIRTSLAQAVADELHTPLATISFVMADTDLTPFDQGTFGSRTTPAMAPVIARAAATAREMLIDLAAEHWKVDRASLTARDGAIVDGAGPSTSLGAGRSIGFGELTSGRSLAGRVAASAPELTRDKWVVRGRSVHKVNGRDIVTGRQVFTPDITRPGLLIGCVIHPPAMGAKPVSVNTTAAAAMPDVVVVRDGDFIGVAAPNERRAKAAAEAVRVEWTTPAGLPDSQTIYEHLKRTAAPAGGRGGGATGNLTDARSRSARTFEASYRIPYIAHVPLEPRTAVAEWQDGRVTVWTGTQRPFGVRGDIAQAFGLAEDRVRVIVPDFGSGYGGKHTNDAAIEAARLAKAAKRPVKVVYTRAEEFMWGYLRPAGVIDIRAGVDASGALTFWEFDNYNSGGSGLPTPYTVGSKREAFRAADSPFKQGSYRGLAATANHYAREMQMDAIARALGIDAVEFRLRHLDNPRMQAVLKTVAERSGWPRASAPGRALGIACGTEKGSYIATAAEVSRTAAGFRVERIVAAFECGAIVNPDGLNNQVEGAIVQGLGGALFEAIEFANGKILNGRMATYRVPRFKDVPPIEIHLLDRKDLPSAGAGETPIVCVAPAIGSAVRAFGAVATELPVKLVRLP